MQAAGWGIEHIDGLYGYAMMLTRNRARAEDLTQDTYVRALEAASRLRENSNVKGWLFTIMRNLWLNELRKHRSTPPLVEIDNDPHTAESIPGGSPNSYEILTSTQDADMVRHAIEQLPSDAREIIVLREYEDLSYQQIAEILDCPPGTVMSRLARARAKLRALLSMQLQTPRSVMEGRADS